MICPDYTRSAFGMVRCRGANLAGKCGHPDMTCPLKQKPVQLVQPVLIRIPERKIDYVW